MERTPHLQWAAQPPLEAPPQIASQQISQPLSGQHSLAPVSGDGPLASLESQASSPGLTGFSSDPRGFALISSADGSFHSGVSSQLGVGALQPGPLVGECAAASASQSWGEDRRHPPQPASFRAGAKIASSCSVDGVETAAGGRGPCLAAQSRSGGGGGERRSVDEASSSQKESSASSGAGKDGGTEAPADDPSCEAAVVPLLHRLMQQLLQQLGCEETPDPQVLPLLCDLFQRESLRIACAAAEIGEYRATGAAPATVSRHLAAAPLRIDVGDASAAVQEYVQREAPQQSTSQDLSRLSRLTNTLALGSGSAELLALHRFGAAAEDVLDEGAEEAAAAAASSESSLPFGKKNILGAAPTGLPPLLPEDVNACTLLPPWSLQTRRPALPAKGASSASPSGVSRQQQQPGFQQPQGVETRGGEGDCGKTDLRHGSRGALSAAQFAEGSRRETTTDDASAADPFAVFFDGAGAAADSFAEEAGGASLA